MVEEGTPTSAWLELANTLASLRRNLQAHPRSYRQSSFQPRLTRPFLRLDRHVTIVVYVLNILREKCVPLSGRH